MTTGSRSGPHPPRVDGNDHFGTPGSLLFLCGADMHPSLITARAGLGRARFVAIARIDGRHADQAGLPPALASGEIWGIALTSAPAVSSSSSGPGARAMAAMVPIVLRDGTSAAAALMTDPTTVGSVADVLREAHYWELPVGYRNRLEALLPS